MIKRFSKLIFAFVLVAMPLSAFAEYVPDDEYGYSLDLPEGFRIADATEDGMSYLFAHDRMPVELILKLYDNTMDAPETMAIALKRLHSTYGEMETFEWRNVDCAVTQFKMMGQYEGWGLSVPLALKNATLVLLCYAPSDVADSVQQFIISCINSLAVDRGSYYEPGPITTFAFPKTGALPVTLEIAGKSIKTEIDSDDVEAAQFLVECEYAVLTIYAGHEKWREAWQRYYRMIFRDSAGRMKRVAFDIRNTLMPLASGAARSGNTSEGVSTTAIDTDGNAQPLTIATNNEKVALVQMLLSWTQDFSYERGKAASTDFTPVPACLLGEGNDCDSRAMLLSAISHHLGINSAVFVSREYGHALYGADLPEKGAKIKAGETEYLLGETTTKVALGLVAQEFSDIKKWLAIPMPY